MASSENDGTERILIAAFEGWNDAGEAASRAVSHLVEALNLETIFEVDSEHYFDYQFNRPTVEIGENGQREIEWPTVLISGPARPSKGAVYVLSGTEPARNWKQFTSEILGMIEELEIEKVITVGSMLADVPHTRPIAIFASSDNDKLRELPKVERSTYEGPVGILSVLAVAAESVEIPTLSIWASVPHYVHNTPSPKAALALLERLEQYLDRTVDHRDLEKESEDWVKNIDSLAEDDEDMARYIEQLEKARDTVDSPEASGDAIAEEFERYLRHRDDNAEGQFP
ncbi:MAG: PAC2 family protein [Cryobacterium sp.]|nr:PAC2 family protein [Cryobacterium sp.]MBX3090622.1 PAC2 family protein [Cryobacterium sp.]MBX3116240.1 PAC2 family protein [Cryobacterium sp.]